MLPTEWRLIFEAIYSVLFVWILSAVVVYALRYIAPNLVNTKLSFSYKFLLYSFLAVGVGTILIILIFFTPNGLVGWTALAIGLLSWAAYEIYYPPRKEPKQ